jgi:TolB-like protein
MYRCKHAVSGGYFHRGETEMASAASEDTVRAALQRLLTSKYFAQAESLSNLLRYLVEETLAGRGPELKEFTLGCEVFGRGESFDPKTDGIVRVQASRLRAKLRDYYAAEGKDDELVVSVPAGAYAAEFLPFTKTHTPPPSAWPKWFVWAGAAATLAVLVLWLGAYVRNPRIPKIESVAVLPFRNLTGDASQGYLSDGLTDMLITDLGKLPGLRVISRTTAMTFASSQKSLTTVAKEWKVDALVEGSMTRAGENIRVNVNIIEVRDQERNLWSNTFEHGAREIATLQDEINRQVAAQFRADRQPVPPRAPTESNHDAYLAYLKGRQLAGQNSEAGLRDSLQWFDKATTLDPNMASAKASQALSYIFLSDFWIMPAEALPLAKALAASAVEQDPYSAEAYTARGAVALFLDRDSQAAETDLRQAIKLNPNNGEARIIYGFLCGAVGRFDEAVASVRRAVQNDPLSPRAHAMLLWMLLLTGRYQDVEQTGLATLQLFPGHPFIQLWVGSSLALRGEWQKAKPYFEGASNLDQLPLAPIFVGLMHAVNRDKPAAKAQLAKAHQIGKKRYICAYEIASVHSVLGEMDEAYKWMDRALVERCMCLNWLMTEKWMQSFRDDPRFPALVARVGLWNKARSF